MPEAMTASAVFLARNEVHRRSFVGSIEELGLIYRLPLDGIARLLTPIGRRSGAPA
jgi:hypothetical protein